MSGTTAWNLDELVDGQRIRAFNLSLLGWSFLAMLVDGYDLYAAAFSAPSLVREWGLAKSALAPMFSASLLGILFGAPLLGWVGDRWGRRAAMIAGCILCGAFSLLSARAGSLNELVWLRFLTGLGLGGIMPNAISLNAELAPKRSRATLVILMFAGITVGGAVPGLVAAQLVPTHGWRILYWIGGVAPLVIAACLFVTLPESIKFLALQPGREAEVRRLVARMRPDLVIPEGARFVLPRPAAGVAAPGGIGELFRGGLAVITPLLWLLFVLNLMTSYLLTNWMPILFESNGLSPGNAALANATYQIGGLAGGVALSMLLDRVGLGVVVALFVIGCPAVAAIGLPGLGDGGLIAVAGFAGFCILGLQFALNASAGLLYPTAVRAKGVGLAFAVGRFGSILGPFLGAALIAAEVGLPRLFLLTAIPLAVGAVAATAMAVLCWRRFGGRQISDVPRGMAALADAGH